MHKIRVYVMPEVREEEPEDVTIEDIDSSTELPPIMQRKNSRRPTGCGTLRLNIIQKDRRADSITPKLKQIGQQLAKNESKIDCSTSSVNTSLNYKIQIIDNSNEDDNNNNSNNNNNNLDHADDYNEEIENRMKIGKIDSAKNSSENNEKKNVLTSSKKITVGLVDRVDGVQSGCLKKQVEKMIGPISVVNFGGKDLTPRKMIRNDKNPCCSSRLLSPIFESSASSSPSNTVKNSKENNAAKIATNVCKNDFTDSYRFGNDTATVNDGYSADDKNIDREQVVIVNRLIEMKNDSLGHTLDFNINGAQNQSSRNNNNNDGSSNTTSGNNSVILRRNNKLNRYREYDLEQKIEVEIKMREGSARLLAAARHRAQSLEAARALLTSNERMSAYMAELQRRKKEPSNKPSLPASTARVSLSDLRVPLMWRDSDHFKNRGDYRRFAVFCLARVGTEIHDTALLCPVDRALTDVTFPDLLVFNNVPPDFEVTLEIYSHILQEDLSIASTPRRIKRSIHSSISRTVGKKLAASLRDELNSGKIGPHFELMASARLTLDDTDDNIHTHDLVLNNLENKTHSLPLFGHFCCRLAAQPECVTEEACSGNIVLDGRSCWARIQGFKLQAWDSRKLAEEEQSPSSTVPINRETLIQPSKSSSKELRISNTIDGSDKITTIRLETADEAQKWVRQLVAHAKDHLRWRHAAETIQDVPSVESARNSFIGNKRQGSLYDETPLIESVQSDYTTNRPTVQEIFGLTTSTSLSSCSSSTSSPPSLRSRSLSTSGVRKSGTNTLRSHWPFSNKNHD